MKLNKAKQSKAKQSKEKQSKATKTITRINEISFKYDINEFIKI